MSPDKVFEIFGVRLKDFNSFGPLKYIYIYISDPESITHEEDILVRSIRQQCAAGHICYVKSLIPLLKVTLMTHFEIQTVSQRVFFIDYPLSLWQG